MTAPQWLDQFREQIAGAFQCPEQVVVNARWNEEEDQEQHWEVVAYPTLREIIFGRHDGERVYPRFLLNVEALSRMLDKNWGMTLDGGCVPLIPAALHLCGLYRGKRVHIRVLLAPPEDAEPVDLLDAHTGAVIPRRQ
jgi:hypothetical protein